MYFSALKQCTSKVTFVFSCQHGCHVKTELLRKLKELHSNQVRPSELAATSLLQPVYNGRIDLFFKNSSFLHECSGPTYISMRVQRTYKAKVVLLVW